MSDFTSTLDRSQHVAVGPLAFNQPLGEAMYSARQGFASAAAAWPSANRALFMPIIIETPIEIFQMAAYNGAVAGEVDIGIYSYPGTGTSAKRLVSSGKVAMAGASQPQVFNIADTLLLPGYYFFAFVCSTVTTATFQRAQPGTLIAQASGMAQMNSALPLPETATLARIEIANVPVVNGYGFSLAL